MKFNKNDSIYSNSNSYSNKEKNLNNSIDSSRTTDTISNSYNSDIIPLKNDIEIDIDKRNDIYYNSILYDDNILNLNDNKIDINDKVDNKKHKANYFKFKMQISIILCTIYLFLFLISMPKRLIKTNTVVKDLNSLLKGNETEKIHIMINNLQFSFIKNETKKNNNDEFSGYLLEYNYNKKYITRWIIGFIYFAVRNFCFVFSDYQKINKNYMFKNKVDFLQKFSCLLFPLYLFYYDVMNNTNSFISIKNEKIRNKIIYYYVMTDKQRSWSDYVEGIVPTLSYFLISLIYDGMEQSIGTYLNGKRKISKLV